MGAVGVVAVLLLIGLASIIKDRASESAATAVVGAAATSTPAASTGVGDPLAEAGVIPEMPASLAPETNAPGGAGTIAPPAPNAAPGGR